MAIRSSVLQTRRLAKAKDRYIITTSLIESVSFSIRTFDPAGYCRIMTSKTSTTSARRDDNTVPPRRTASGSDDTGTGVLSPSTTSRSMVIDNNNDHNNKGCPTTTNNNHTRRLLDEKQKLLFQNNSTIFGKILRGELPAHIVYEDSQLLVFDDIAPASTYHWLIIPKRHITQPSALTSKDGPLIDDMVRVAKELVIEHYNNNNKTTTEIENEQLILTSKAASTSTIKNNNHFHHHHHAYDDDNNQNIMDNVSMGFHVFPLLSVYHLHMHVIFPMPAKSLWYRWVFPQDHGLLYKTPQYIKERYCSDQSAQATASTSPSSIGVDDPSSSSSSFPPSSKL